MPYKFTFTQRFKKHFKQLTLQEKKQLKSKLELLAKNPSHPSLRTKRIQGTTDLFECSVNMDIRIIWYYENDKIITFFKDNHLNTIDKQNLINFKSFLINKA